MEGADLIKKILARRGLSQTALAEILGVDRSLLTNYVNGKREPGAVPCLLLAALSESEEEHQFWISQSGLETNQVRLIAKALSMPEPELLDGPERALLQWWRVPSNPMDQSVKAVVEKLLDARSRRH